MIKTGRSALKELPLPGGSDVKKANKDRENRTEEDTVTDIKKGGRWW